MSPADFEAYSAAWRARDEVTAYRHAMTPFIISGALGGKSELESFAVGVASQATAGEEDFVVVDPVQFEAAFAHLINKPNAQ